MSATAEVVTAGYRAPELAGPPRVQRMPTCVRFEWPEIRRRRASHVTAVRLWDADTLLWEESFRPPVSLARGYTFRFDLTLSTTGSAHHSLYDRFLGAFA